MAASARVTQPLLTSIALPSPYCVLFEAHNDTLLPFQLILIIINDLSQVTAAHSNQTLHHEQFND